MQKTKRRKIEREPTRFMFSFFRWLHSFEITRQLAATRHRLLAFQFGMRVGRSGIPFSSFFYPPFKFPLHSRRPSASVKQLVRSLRVLRWMTPILSRLVRRPLYLFSWNALPSPSHPFRPLEMVLQDSPVSLFMCLHRVDVGIC